MSLTVHCKEFSRMEYCKARKDANASVYQNIAIGEGI